MRFSSLLRSTKVELHSQKDCWISGGQALTPDEEDPGHNRYANYDMISCVWLYMYHHIHRKTQQPLLGKVTVAIFRYDHISLCLRPTAYSSCSSFPVILSPIYSIVNYSILIAFRYTASPLTFAFHRNIFHLIRTCYHALKSKINSSLPLLFTRPV